MAQSLRPAVYVFEIYISISRILWRHAPTDETRNRLVHCKVHPLIEDGNSFEVNTLATLSFLKLLRN